MPKDKPINIEKFVDDVLDSFDRSELAQLLKKYIGVGELFHHFTDRIMKGDPKLKRYRTRSTFKL